MRFTSITLIITCAVVSFSAVHTVSSAAYADTGPVEAKEPLSDMLSFSVLKPPKRCRRMEGRACTFDASDPWVYCLDHLNNNARKLCICGATPPSKVEIWHCVTVPDAL